MVTILAAAARGDDAEVQALKSSAPTRIWKLSSHYFLSVAIETLGLAHAALLLSGGVTLMSVLNIVRKDAPRPDNPEHDPYEILGQTAKTIREGEAGFRLFCKEADFDPDMLMMDQPGSGNVSEGGPLMMRNIPLVLDMAAVFCPDELIDPDHVRELADGYKGLFERLS